LWDNISFNIYKTLPLFREMAILIEYGSTRTSLEMSDYLTVSDTYFNMKTTKFNEKAKNKNNF